MKVRVLSVAAVICAAFVMGTQAPLSQSIAQEKATETKSEKKAEGRVPAFYAQVGLSKEQREKIYAVQTKYTEQIQALQKQISDLEGKRDTEVQAVLTADQQKQLATLQEAAKKKASEARSKKKPAEADAKKPAAESKEAK